MEPKNPIGPPKLSEPSFQVEGMNFVVTGASKGLGWCLVQELAKSGAAYIFLIGGRGESPIDTSKKFEGCEMEYTKSDLASREGVETVLEKIRSAFTDRRLDGLCNVAGKSFPRATLAETDFDTFDQMFSINCRAPIFLMKEAVDIMKKQKSQGAVVNISSVAAIGGAPTMFAYSAAKAALNNATTASALEVRPYHIRINAIDMGWTLTDSELKYQKENNEDWLDSAQASHPMGRLLRPIDLAASIGHLLSPASRMITGSILNVCPEFIDGTVELKE